MSKDVALELRRLTDRVSSLEQSMDETTARLTMLSAILEGVIADNFRASLSANVERQIGAALANMRKIAPSDWMVMLEQSAAAYLSALDEIGKRPPFAR